MSPKALAISLILHLFVVSAKGTTCDSIILNNQNEVNSFNALGCDSIFGSLIIRGLAITNLDSLISLRFVSGDVIIDSTSIQALAGLDSLRHVGSDFRITACFSLIEADGLLSLTHLGSLLLDTCTLLERVELNSFTFLGSATISRNPNLHLVNIANNLFENSYGISIQHNPNLDSAILLQNRSEVPFLSFYNNSELSYIQPFENLVVLGSLYILNNDNLEEIVCFPSLIILGGQSSGSGFTISENDSLTLVDFPKLRQAEQINLSNNPLLNDCCFIWDLTLEGGLNSSFGINSNGSLCNSLAIILTACEANDPDGDNYQGSQDNCPDLYNPSQADLDMDGVGNDCDNCPNTSNPDQLDTNQNGIGDVCDSNYSNKIGLHTNDPKAGVQIDSSDIYIGDIQRGLILRNFLGNCYRVSIDEVGQIKTTQVPCPN